jgi:hypothetical protein
MDVWDSSNKTLSLTQEKAADSEQFHPVEKDDINIEPLVKTQQLMHMDKSSPLTVRDTNIEAKEQTVQTQQLVPESNTMAQSFRESQTNALTPLEQADYFMQQMGAKWVPSSSVVQTSELPAATRVLSPNPIISPERTAKPTEPNAHTLQPPIQDVERNHVTKGYEKNNREVDPSEKLTSSHSEQPLTASPRVVTERVVERQLIIKAGTPSWHERVKSKNNGSFGVGQL